MGSKNDFSIPPVVYGVKRRSVKGTLSLALRAPLTGLRAYAGGMVVNVSNLSI